MKNAPYWTFHEDARHFTIRSSENLYMTEIRIHPGPKHRKWPLQRVIGWALLEFAGLRFMLCTLRNIDAFDACWRD